LIGWHSVNNKSAFGGVLDSANPKKRDVNLALAGGFTPETMSP